MATTITLRHVDAATAKRLIDAAEAKATEMGVPSCVAICDPSGVLKAFLRMDGAALMTIQVAQDKAYTAIGFGGLSSDAWYDFIKNDPPLAAGAVAGVQRLIAFGGGYPLMADGELIGGIGVAGGHWSQDMDVAKAALAALES